MDYIIRELASHEVGMLPDFLYEAIFVPEGEEAPPRTILELPELQIYVKDFGSAKDDYCYVAEVEGQVVGAVWVRIIDDYGHIADDTPSLSISLKPAYRAKGIGTALMKKILTRLQEEGYPQVSLSVQKKNMASRLYQRLGFVVFEDKGDEYIMCYSLV